MIEGINVRFGFEWEIPNHVEFNFPIHKNSEKKMKENHGLKKKIYSVS